MIAVEDRLAVVEAVARALAEDIGTGDVTSQWVLPPELGGRGRFLVKESGVIAGLEVAAEVFRQVDPEVAWRTLIPDGSAVGPGDVVAEVAGRAQSLLSAERVALNFLQRMSGIATLARRYVEAVQGTRAIILDTRKTVPGLRVLDKLAVRIGGAANHRFGLFDMVLIKDNHIAAAGSIRAAVERARAHNRARLPIEVEVTNLDQLAEALSLGVDRILLDNMDLETMRRAVDYVDGRVELEASGGITLENVADVAATGVTHISVGALTHSVKALDISLELET
ncbi:MAG: carboxylating nicotinate-nucleotide diphosphorylase [Anaerolineae bacterium]|nr:carboxylating nicotinate-nucleotide diphosphorylase [Anaerolineae bacterium]